MSLFFRISLFSYFLKLSAGRGLPLCSYQWLFCVFRLVQEDLTTSQVAASVLRQAFKQSFQVHVDEDAEQTGHVGQTVGSHDLSVRKSDLEATNSPLKVLSSVSISIDHQMNENAG